MELTTRIGPHRVAMHQVPAPVWAGAVIVPCLLFALNRYDEIKVVSHAGSQFEAVPVNNVADIRANLLPDTTVVALDRGAGRVLDPTDVAGLDA